MASPEEERRRAIAQSNGLAAIIGRDIGSKRPQAEPQYYDPAWEGFKDWLPSFSLDPAERVRAAAEAEAAKKSAGPTGMPPVSMPTDGQPSGGFSLPNFVRGPMPWEGGQPAAPAPVVSSVDPNKPAGERQGPPMVQPPVPAQNVPATVPTASNGDNTIAGIQAQKAMIDAIYPQQNFANPQQDAADDYAAKGMDRTKLMAQLAFFAGITKGAGGQWEAVGQGLAAGGDAYDQGFQRYQSALQGKATRAADINSSKYQGDVARTDAAIGLYKQQQNLEKDQISTARQAIKDRQDDIDKYFSKRVDAIKGTDLEPTDPKLRDDLFRAWQRSKDQGVIIDEILDVRDPAPKAK